MKKFFAFTVIFCLVNFSGCSKLYKTVNLAESGYTCIGEITLENAYKVTAEISVLGGGLLNIKVVKPQSLKNLTFCFDNNNISVEFLSIKKNIENANNLNLFVSYIGGAFLKALSDNRSAVFKNNGYYFEDSYMNNKFILKVQRNGLPISLEFSNPKIKVIFSDIKQ